MLVLVVTVFLVIEIPLMIITILHALSSDTLDYEVAEIVILVINILTCLTSPLNFAIYCGTSKEFRNKFGQLFLTHCRGAET